MIYQLYKTRDGKDAAMATKQDGSMISFVFDENNTDYQEFLRWKEEGNTPLPADE